MRLGRPKSLSGLLLIGFTLVIILPLGAAVNATVKMRHVTQRSAALVEHSADATSHSQVVFAEAAELLNKSRLYASLGEANERDDFRQSRARFERSLAALDAMTRDAASRSLIAGLRTDVIRLASALERDPGGDTD